MCDIIFLIASYGTGHRQVALALQKAIRQMEPSIKTEVVDFLDLVDPYFNELTQWLFIRILKYNPSLWRILFKRTENVDIDSISHNILNLLGSKKLINFIEKEDPKVIVCTYPIQVGVLSRLKRLKLVDKPIVSVVTDIAVHSFWLHPYVDLYIVANDYAKEMLISKGVPPYKIGATGLPIDPSFSEPIDKDRCLKIFGLDGSVPVVSAMMGGYGLDDKLVQVVDVLMDIDIPFQGIVATGHNRRVRRLLRERTKEKENIKIFGYIHHARELMAISDILITKAGGITISEALAMETPMVLYGVIPGHEEENAQFLINNMAALMARDSSELERNVRALLLDRNLAESIKVEERRLRKPTSSLDGAKLILELYKDRKGTRT
ncbi:MAG: MGDG synthase family glycosyltransferase [bacterium]